MMASLHLRKYLTSYYWYGKIRSNQRLHMKCICCGAIMTYGKLHHEVEPFWSWKWFF